MLNYWLESIVCMAVFYTVYYVGLRQDTFFQRNRFYLLISSGLSLLIPAFKFEALGKGYALIQPYFMPELQLNQFQNTSPSEFTLTVFQAAIIFYALVSIVLFLRFIRQIWRLVALIRKSATKIGRGYILVPTEGKLPTFSFLNYLFWDNTQELTEADADKILHHELKHIYDRHSYDLLYIEFIKIWFWFNPFVYLYEKALRFQHEFIADASVLRESDSQSYSALLVKTLFKNLNLPLSHGFNKSEIKQRIEVMKKLRTPAQKFWKTWVALPFLAVLIFAFASKAPVVEAEFKPEEQNRFVNVEGGLDNFYKLLSKEITYPSNAPQNLKGRVFVQFTVNKNGQLSNFKVAKSLHPIVDESVIKAIQHIKVKWIPAKVDGNIVKQQITLPVLFK
jgi:TonB family protein